MLVIRFRYSNFSTEERRSSPSFYSRCDPAEFVKEVEDECDFVELVFGLRLRSLQNGEALAIGVEIEVAGPRTAINERALGPQARFVVIERIALDRISNNPYSLIGGTVEQFLPVSGPRRILAASSRDLPLAFMTRKRADVDLGFSRLIGLVSKPSSIPRESRFTLDKGTCKKNGWGSGFPSFCLITVHRKNQYIPIRLGSMFPQREKFPSRMPGHRYLVILTFGKALQLTGSIGSLPINVECRFVSANRAERDAAAIRSPDRIPIGQR